VMIVLLASLVVFTRGNKCRRAFCSPSDHFEAPEPFSPLLAPMAPV
jgi:hypothetical protein